MHIQTKLTEKDFINANLTMLYSKPFLRFATGLVGGGCLLLLIASFFVPGVTIFSALVPLLAISALPLATYFGAKKIYKQSATVSETISYYFEEDSIRIQGESFTGLLTWNKVYKVTKTRNWLLIWQNSQQASPIPRRNVRDLDLPRIAGILNKNGVKNNL